MREDDEDQIAHLSAIVLPNNICPERCTLTSGEAFLTNDIELSKKSNDLLQSFATHEYTVVYRQSEFSSLITPLSK